MWWEKAADRGPDHKNRLGCFDRALLCYRLSVMGWHCRAARAREQHPVHVSLWWDHVLASLLPTFLSVWIHRGFLIHFVSKIFRAIPVLITQCLRPGLAMPSQLCQGRTMRTISGALLSWLYSGLSKFQVFSLLRCRSYCSLPWEQRD